MMSFDEARRRDARARARGVMFGRMTVSFDELYPSKPKGMNATEYLEYVRGVFAGRELSAAYERVKK